MCVYMHRTIATHRKTQTSKPTCLPLLGCYTHFADTLGPGAAVYHHVSHWRGQYCGCNPSRPGCAVRCWGLFKHPCHGCFLFS